MEKKSTANEQNVGVTSSKKQSTSTPIDKSKKQCDIFSIDGNCDVDEFCVQDDSMDISMGRGICKKNIPEGYKEIQLGTGIKSLYVKSEDYDKLLTSLQQKYEKNQKDITSTDDINKMITPEYAEQLIEHQCPLSAKTN